MACRKEDLVRRLQQPDAWLAELDQRIERVVWRNSLPSRDKNMPMKVFQQSHVELETDSGGNLVARAQRGEEAAFTALFDAYKRRVYGFCLRMTGSPQDAEKLTEEAFLGVFRKISTFRGESAFSAWLQRLAVKVVLMHLRKKRVQEVPLAQRRSHELWPQR